MRDDEWEQRLEHTRDHVRENLGGDAEDGPGDEHQNLRRLFVRYLVWDEFVAARSERSRQIQTDVQPSFEQLNTFFFQFMETGATLADICHTFPQARDTQMLVYRIERFATLRTYPDRVSRTGAMEPVENRYIPKPFVTLKDRDRIQGTIVPEGVVTRIAFGLSSVPHSIR